MTNFTDSQILPMIGQWYKDIEQHVFEVVAMDDESVEVQYFDGDVEAFDLDIWEQLHVLPIAIPGDGSGPFDEMDDLPDDEHMQEGYW